MRLHLIMEHPVLFLLITVVVLLTVAYTAYTIVSTLERNPNLNSKRFISKLIDYGLLVFYSIGR
jgi:hypothetical protein